MTVLDARNAADGLQNDDSVENRRAVLDLCDTAGSAKRAGIRQLRSFACKVNEELIRERPGIKDFGAVKSKTAPGDPLRSDAEFQAYAYMVLNFEEGPEWLDGPAPVIGLLGNDDHEYRAGLRHLSKVCATRPPAGKRTSLTSAG